MRTLIVIIICCVTLMLMFHGCTTTHKNYNFQQIKIEDKKYSIFGKFVGRQVESDDNANVTGTPYRLTMMFITKDSTVSYSDCEMMLTNLSLREIDTDKVVFKRNNLVSKFKKFSDKEYSASFYFKNLDLEYVDHKLELSFQSSGKCTQDISKRKMEHTIKRDYQEKRISFWDTLMGV